MSADRMDFCRRSWKRRNEIENATRNRYAIVSFRENFSLFKTFRSLVTSKLSFLLLFPCGSAKMLRWKIRFTSGSIYAGFVLRENRYTRRVFEDEEPIEQGSLG